MLEYRQRHSLPWGIRALIKHRFFRKHIHTRIRSRVDGSAPFVIRGHQERTRNSQQLSRKGGQAQGTNKSRRKKKGVSLRSEMPLNHQNRHTSITTSITFLQATREPSLCPHGITYHPIWLLHDHETRDNRDTAARPKLPKGFRSCRSRRLASHVWSERREGCNERTCVVASW